MNKNRNKNIFGKTGINRVKKIQIRLIMLSYFGFLVILLFSIIYAQENESSNQQSDYRIEKPGTITFTVGVKILGKVEKPQVMIFLPKEKTLYRKNTLKRSFSNEINTPLPFTPLIE